jgi:hypothetical protein
LIDGRLIDHAGVDGGVGAARLGVAAGEREREEHGAHDLDLIRKTAAAPQRGASMKFAEGFEKQLLAYAQKGLAEAKRRKAKQFRLWWSMSAPHGYLYFLLRYIDGEIYDDGSATKTRARQEELDGVPAFPMDKIRALAKKSKGSDEFFRNEDQLYIWDDASEEAAFFSGPRIEAGEWMKIVIDLRIYAVKQQLQKERGRVKIDVRPHDWELLYDPNRIDVRTIKEMRQERGYEIDVSVIEKLLALMTDHVDPKWIAAAKKLK